MEMHMPIIQTSLSAYYQNSINPLGSEKAIFFVVVGFSLGRAKEREIV